MDRAENMEAVFEDHDGDSLYHARVPVAAGESFYTADSSTTRVVSLKQVAEETTATPLIVSARASIETFATGDTLDLSADGSSSWNEDMNSPRGVLPSRAAHDERSVDESLAPLPTSDRFPDVRIALQPGAGGDSASFPDRRLSKSSAACDILPQTDTPDFCDHIGCAQHLTEPTLHTTTAPHENSSTTTDDDPPADIMVEAPKSKKKATGRLRAVFRYCLNTCKEMLKKA